jgi:hypothetical protein
MLRSIKPTPQRRRLKPHFLRVFPGYYCPDISTAAPKMKQIGTPKEAS